VYEDTRNVHLVLDLCTGGDLHDFITHCPGNRMSEREAAVVCRSMLEALAFCHVRGVIHRDVKPENFLLEAPGSVAGGVKVSDFGVSAFYAPGQVGVVDGDTTG
jgi:serine/threonine protein kinase